MKRVLIFLLFPIASFAQVRTLTTRDSVKFATKTALATKLPISGGNLTGALNELESASIASAATINLAALVGNVVHITGSTAITALGTAQAGTRRTLIFDGNPIITNNATSLILPGNASIQTAIGDIATFLSEGSGNWRCTGYVKTDETYTNYTPTVTGYSTLPTIVAGDCRYKMLGRNTYHLYLYIASGVSNTNALTVTLPFSWPTVGNTGYIPCYVNSGGTQAIGCFRPTSGSNVINVFPTGAGASGVWATSGVKYVVINTVLQSDLQ